MAEKQISALPVAASVNDSSLFVVEQHGEAMSATGALWKSFAKEAVSSDVAAAASSANAAAASATQSADSATTAASRASDAANAQAAAEAAAASAQTARDNIANMTVSASTIEPDDEASVTKTELLDGSITLHFDIPRGQTGAQGLQGVQGIQGEKGEKGDTGKGLTILDYYPTYEELSTKVPFPKTGDAYGVGAAEPYDIYIYSDAAGWVNNGQLQGASGQDGFSPTVAVEAVTNGNKVTITDKTGAHEFTVRDGEKGDTGATGATGAPGADGEDGFSPTVAVSDITGGHRVTFTTATGNTSFDVMDGETPESSGSADKLTTARSVLVNLASTAAASFDGTADITPGVTGTLPLARGGTGGTNASGGLYNLIKGAPTISSSNLAATDYMGIVDTSNSTGAKLMLSNLLLWLGDNLDVGSKIVYGTYVGSTTEDNVGAVINLGAKPSFVWVGANRSVANFGIRPPWHYYIENSAEHNVMYSAYIIGDDFISSYASNATLVPVMGMADSGFFVANVTCKSPVLNNVVRLNYSPYTYFYLAVFAS